MLFMTITDHITHCVSVSHAKCIWNYLGIKDLDVTKEFYYKSRNMLESWYPSTVIDVTNDQC